MPTRIIREGILDSRIINLLSEQSELFYRRLMSVVDDYGRCEADPDKLRARCFPLQLERWPSSRVEECLEECSTLHGDSRLITVYLCGNKKLLQINNFGQRLQSKAKYPSPDSPESTVIHGEPRKPTVINRLVGVGVGVGVEDVVGVVTFPAREIPVREIVDKLKPATPKGSAKGSRFNLTDLPDEWRDWAIADRQWDVVHVVNTFAIFADFWRAKSGKDASKLDWFATWRNWCRNERSPSGFAPNGFSATRETATEKTLRIATERVIKTGRL